MVPALQWFLVHKLKMTGQVYAIFPAELKNRDELFIILNNSNGTIAAYRPEKGTTSENKMNE